MTHQEAALQEAEHKLFAEGVSRQSIQDVVNLQAEIIMCYDDYVWDCQAEGVADYMDLPQYTHTILSRLMDDVSEQARYIREQIGEE